MIRILGILSNRRDEIDFNLSRLYQKSQFISKMNQNWLNLIDPFLYKSTFLIWIDLFNINWLFRSFINNFDLLIDFFDLLIDLYWSFNQKEIENDWLLSKLDQNYIEITIVESNLSLKSESDQNLLSNLAALETKSSTIRF